MIRSLLLSCLFVFVSACGSLQPVKDDATRATLELKPALGTKELYPAPVFSVLLPSYLNESTVWYLDSSGTLVALTDYIWVDSLSKAIQRELTVALAKPTAFSGDTRIDIGLPRFILREDGSAIALAEVKTSTANDDGFLPIMSVEVADAWNLDQPETYLQGYQKLLQATVDVISKELDSTLPKKSP